MNYKNIYDNLIYHRQVNILTKQSNVYYEIHHIIPKSLGGLNDKTNLVALTAREHYIAHLLLWKYYKQIHNKPYEIKMLYALMRLMTGNDEFKINISPTKFSSRLYQKVRAQMSAAQSEKAKNSRFFHNNKNEIIFISLDKIETLSNEWLPGTGLSSEGLTGYISIININTDEQKYIKSDDNIPIGWVRGGRHGYKNDTRWYNDGKINIKLKNTDKVPSGFIPGRILSKKFKDKSDGVTSGTTGLQLIQNSQTGKCKYIKPELIDKYVYDGSNWVKNRAFKRKFSDTAKNNISINRIKSAHPEITSFENFDFSYYKKLSKRDRRLSILQFKKTGSCYLC